MPKLTFTYEGEERVVEVVDSCSIGRAPQNTVALEKETGASRRHLQIMKLSQSFELTDLGSTNGTKVNGRKVTRHRLEHGDRIEIGATLLVWTERDDEDEIDLEEEISLDDSAPAKKKPAAGRATGSDCYLVFAGGDRDGERIALDRSRVTFGRKGSNTVVFDSAAVSGYHCEISREGGAYVLRDLGSTNGTLLDGEPVTETALQHGGRLRVGDRRLVFVDPSVSDFEKAMAGVDDVGAEWGMLRAEMDVSRVRKARRGAVVGTLLLLGLLAGAAYVLFARPDLLRKETVELADVEGNLVDDFSFEQIASGWEAVDGSPARGSFETEGHQGDSSYSVVRDGRPGRPAAVEFRGRDFPVRPNAVYEFGAKAKASGGGLGAVRVSWIGAGEGAAARYASSPLVDAGSWTDVKGRGAAPADATAVRLQLVNAGEGKVTFDDVFLKEAGRDDRSEVADGNVSVSAGVDGHLVVKRGVDVLLADLAVVGGLLTTGADTGDRAVRGGGTAAATSVATTDGGVQVKGRALDPGNGTLGDYVVTATPRDGRYVDVTATLPAGAALEGALPQTFMESGIGVVLAGGSSVRETQTRGFDKVRGVSVGTNVDLFEVVSDEVFSFNITARRGTACAFGAGAEGGTINLRIDTATREIVKRRDELFRQAEQAEHSRSYADAIRWYSEWALGRPEGDQKRVDALARARRIESEGEKQLESVRKDAENASRFDDTDGLRKAQQAAARLLSQYGLTGAQDVVDTATQRLGELREKDALQRAGPLLARAADFAKAGMTTLAGYAYRDVVKRFDGTQPARDAATALAGLGK